MVTAYARVREAVASSPVNGHTAMKRPALTRGRTVGTPLVPFVRRLYDLLTSNCTDRKRICLQAYSAALQSKAKQSKVKLGEGCSLYAHQIFKQ